MLYKVVFIFIVNIIKCFSQITDDCGVTTACFLYPTDCQNTDCTFVYKWNDIDGVNTNFTLYGNIGTSSNTWLAIGFSKDNEMGDDCVVICKTTNTIEHYYNPDQSPELLNTTMPSVGLFNMNVQVSNNWLMCQFMRKKENNAVQNYFDLNNDYYILAAYGSLKQNGGIQKHSVETSSNEATNFLTLSIVDATEDHTKYKVHGCLMIIAWLLLASTGIVFARYYKFLFGEKKFMGVQFWFTIHRPVMMCVPVLCIIALIIILAQLNWQWIEVESQLEFTHSIFGIVAIAFACLQPFIALLRCEKDAKNRYIFDYVHRCVGLSALLFAIIAMFTGLCIDVIGLASTGWGILLGWFLWFIIFITISEVLAFKDKVETTKNNFYQVDTPQSELAPIPQIKSPKFKYAMLLLHLLISLAFTIILVVIIGVTQATAS